MKIPKKIPEKEAKKLCEIIGNIGLIIQEEALQWYRYVQDGSTYIDYYDVPGYVNRKEFCAYLGYKFDNMGETFVHECLHLRFPEMSESNIDALTVPFWNEPSVRKVARERLIDALGKHKL